MIPSLADNHGADPDKNALEPRRAPAPVGTSKSTAVEPFMMSDGTMLQRVKEAENLSGQYMQTAHRTAWQRSYKAFRNEHFDGSKYLSDAFRSRSKIFRPKTRSTIRKNMASAAEALFATIDPVTISAQDESNPTQVASAAIKQELLSMRLTRPSTKSGIPWFQIAMGARQDSQLTGVCISKQSWKFVERQRGMEKGPDGTMQPKTVVVCDRPDIILYPPENVLVDPSANWLNPAQSGAYLILRHPMQVDEVMSMMTSNPRTTTKWRKVNEEDIKAYSNSPMDAQAVRRAREGGQDTKDRSTTGQAFGIVWVYEVYMRLKGDDYCFWSIEGKLMLSDPKLTEEVYPAHHGERPVVIGYGSIDSHTANPMAPAESWQQLQQEANDLANLRLDHMKQVVSPITKVRRGRQVDLQSIQKRGPNGVVLLKELDDIEFDRPQDVPTSANTESAYINNDFDDLAGSFSQSSVQGNRQLNETVGGMKLLAGGANTMTEFDLKVWCETWTEPVLAQIVQLEEMYEDDETLLAIAGERAQLFVKFGMSEITDQMLMEQSTVRINVGTGAGISDPMQKLQKFGMASKIVAEVLTPFIESGVAKIPEPDIHAIITEVYGAAGYKDGGDRFFKNPDDPERANEPPKEPPPPSPEEQAAAQKAQQAQASHEADQALKQQAHDLKMQTLQNEAQREADKAALEKDLQSHQAIVRAQQREQELDSVQRSAENKKEQERIALAAAKDIAQLKALEARISLAAAKDAADLKRREADLRRKEIEVKTEALEVERLALEAKRKQIALGTETAEVKADEARVKAEEGKAQAKAATKAAEEPPEKPAAKPSAGGASSGSSGAAKTGKRTISFIKDKAGNITGAEY